ncbi:MAG: hypothetical protein H0U57_05440 [Tatlockia sp.]|nr:hypothetical protein [Tatlockia sp.]
MIGFSDLLYIPFAGHTPGHAGIAINTESGWILHAGDAYFFIKKLNVLPGMRFYQWLNGSR